MAKEIEVKKEVKENWVTYAEVGKQEVIAVKKENNIKLYLVK